MKLAIATAVSAVALAAVAGPAFAKEPNVEIRYAVARVAVVVEDRADVAVEVEQGSSRLPRVEVTRVGDEIRVNGGLRRRGGLFNGDNDGINNCNNGPNGGRAGEGAWAEVRGVGRVNVADAPLIVIRTPRDVNVNASGAIYGSVGRGARSLELGHGGCGRWDVANVDGSMSLSIGGSGDIRAGTSSSLEVAIGGSGSVTGRRHPGPGRLDRRFGRRDGLAPRRSPGGRHRRLRRRGRPQRDLSQRRDQHRRLGRRELRRCRRGRRSLHRRRRRRHHCPRHRLDQPLDHGRRRRENRQLILQSP